MQLESFLDPANITSVTCSENPVPVFTRLKEECSTGLLHVPMIGGGTANVEFEVITGMNLGDFGTGEYPYSTILKSETCETIAYDLRNMGYTAHRPSTTISPPSMSAIRCTPCWALIPLPAWNT